MATSPSYGPSDLGAIAHDACFVETSTTGYVKEVSVGTITPSFFTEPFLLPLHHYLFSTVLKSLYSLSSTLLSYFLPPSFLS